MTLENDGRVDLSCSFCGGHMRHIFGRSEEKGRTGQRHCVNDSSIQYLKYAPPDGTEEEMAMTLPLEPLE